ncbi:hypothetical protein RFI_25143 [Reticulomyxa filosa]|uniref:Uncharacterized protein n=1 Tax=Reticulomyxa filosa TaxID=46433 RepID=X6MDY9_RETFI|nr:hypothetical protein RFI_25143 [Reticulomyxa filosa]|eukprot:ETO12233.1 hypothetical protein RFI_25143 [Reticulomyxa filosa]
MGNQNTTIFQDLKELPTPLSHSPCVSYKHEIIICGGWYKKACYSYHTIKNEYKFICEYPSDIKLHRHFVVKMVDSNNNNNKDINQITLLSFGGHENKHTLVMKYVSVWSNILDISNKSDELSNYNQWVPFTDNQNHPIITGRDDDNYEGMRAVIGGIKIICYLLLIFHGILASIFRCFVLNEEKNKQNYQMLLFCWKIGLSIEYDEDNNTFQFHKLVCKGIAPFHASAYVRINDSILFFGGFSYKYNKSIYLKSVHKYSIREDKWITFQNILPSPLYDSIAILSEEDNFIHIIGGEDDKGTTLSIHMKTKVRVWDTSQLSKDEIKFIIEYWIRALKIKLGWIDDFDHIIFKYSRIK